jgi:hypothetical protein
MTVRKSVEAQAAQMTVYDDWRDLADRLGEDRFTSGDSALFWSMYQACKADPERNKGLWKVVRRIGHKFKQQIALSFIQNDVLPLIKGDPLLEWKFEHARDAIYDLLSIDKKTDERSRINTKRAQAPRRKKLSREAIESVLANPRRSRNVSTAARFLGCDRKTLLNRAAELKIKLPWGAKNHR